MNNLLKQLIIDTHKLNEKENGLVGLIYSGSITNGFRDIINIEKYVTDINPSMLYLKSLATGVEIDVYDFDLENYKIKHSESTIYIKLKTKEVGIMF